MIEEGGGWAKREVQGDLNRSQWKTQKGRGDKNGCDDARRERMQDKVGHNTNGDGTQGDTEQITQDEQANTGRHRGEIAR